MRQGNLSLAIEMPPNFGQSVLRGTDAQIGAWIDGANPSRAETVQGYVDGMHATWLAQKAQQLYGKAAAQGDFALEPRFLYNPNLKSIIAMVPAVIPLLLLMIPAMLAVLSVVREKEMGSIINFYVTPVTRLEFLLGKQLPYVALGMLNFFMLTGFAVFFFRVPFTGSFFTFTLAGLFYVGFATALGLLVSSFMDSQIAAIFGTVLITIIPAIQYSGMIDPVSSLQGAGRFVGSIYPTAYFMTIARGVFSKGLYFHDLSSQVWPILISIPVLFALATLLLKKQPG